MSSYAVYLYHQEACLQKQNKTAVTVIQAFSYDFHRNRLSELPWTPRAMFDVCQIVHSGPLKAETSYPKK